MNIELQHQTTTYTVVRVQPSPSPDDTAAMDSALMQAQGLVVLNMELMEELSSQAMSYLLKLARRLHKSGSKLILAAARPSVTQQLLKANYHTIFPILPSVSEALKRLDNA